MIVAAWRLRLIRIEIPAIRGRVVSDGELVFVFFQKKPALRQSGRVVLHRVQRHECKDAFDLFERREGAKLG